MGAKSAGELARLVVTVPKGIAEPYGAALVELGAGAVEERPDPDDDSVQIVLTRPKDDPLEPWQEAARNLYEIFVEELGVPAHAFAMRLETYAANYHDVWLSHLSLMQLTDHIVFAPVDDPTVTPEGQRRLLFRPQPAFGDGSHETTRLAATAIENYVMAHPGCRLLDVGTGNGVLSLVAAALGAFAVGIDIDDAAVRAARANATLNALEEHCHFSSRTLEANTEQFELVVANLEPLTQLELRRAIIDRVAPNGTLILTGFLAEQVASIQEPYLTAGYTVDASQQAEDFVLLRLSAPAQVKGS